MGGGELQHLALLAFEVVQVAHHLAELLDQAARGDQEQLAGLGQLHRGARAVDQGQSQRLFQGLDPPAERRLGHAALLGRPREAAGRGQGDEVLQPFGFQVHRASSGRCRIPRRQFVVTAPLCRFGMTQQATALAAMARKPLV
ncbi:hypothetical protein D3C80_1506730 [compost metagenome]